MPTAGALTALATPDVGKEAAVVAALTRHLSSISLDPGRLTGEAAGLHGILASFATALELSPKSDCSKNTDEIRKWVVFARDLPSEHNAAVAAMQHLDTELACKSVLVGDGFQPSEADVAVFSAVHSFVSHLPAADKQRFNNLMRWIDYIQNVEDFGGAFEKIIVQKATFHPHDKKGGSTSNSNENVRKMAEPVKDDIKQKETEEKKKSSNEPSKKKQLSDKKSTEEKKKVVEKSTSAKDVEVTVTALNIQIGLIRKAYKHPSADSLLVEEIDVGEPNVRQVVSGLAKYCSPEDLLNRRVVLITNVKPGKLRDVMSSGLVLCASSPDQKVVEPLIPPEGATPGERVLFAGYEGKPEDVLNPKKKQLEKVTPDLFTDENGIATYKGTPFMTSAGPCTSSIPKATIK